MSLFHINWKQKVEGSIVTVEWFHNLAIIHTRRIHVWYTYLQPNVVEYAIHGSYGIVYCINVKYG